jgi:ribonuclease R
VLANVAAAEQLAAHHAPCVFRVHAPPSPEKLDALREVLKGFGMSIPPGNRLHPRDLDRALRRTDTLPEAPLIHETVLRSLSRAEYAVDNIGHFGLALAAYAHFTSPIRRYADLLVHRALIAAIGAGTDGVADGAGWEEIASHITLTERRAALAERDAMDRLLAAYLSQSVGSVFQARISGVTRAGIFVTLETNGASGLIPVSTLPHDYYRLDEATQSLVGQRTRRRFRLADRLDVILAQAIPITGTLTFAIAGSAGSSSASAAGAAAARTKTPEPNHRDEHNPGPKGPARSRHGKRWGSRRGRT